MTHVQSGYGTLKINLPLEYIDAVRTLMVTEGVTASEVIRRAVLAQKFLTETIDAGHEVLIRLKGSDEPTRKVVFGPPQG